MAHHVDKSQSLHGFLFFLIIYLLATGGDYRSSPKFIIFQMTHLPHPKIYVGRLSIILFVSCRFFIKSSHDFKGYKAQRP